MNTLLPIRYERLYKNCVYASIANAIYILREPFFSYAQSWDGNTYSFHYGSTRGSLSFYPAQRLAVGAARDETSSRRRQYPQHDAIALFREAGDFVREKALQDPLEYLYDEEGGIVKPIASIGFWLEGDELRSSDDAASFVRHGGEFVFILSKEAEQLTAYFEEEYTLSREELAVVNELFHCRSTGRSAAHKTLRHIIHKNCPGYDACMDSLREIGLRLD